MTSAYTQMHAHTNTNTLQSKLRVQIGWRGRHRRGLVATEMEEPDWSILLEIFLPPLSSQLSCSLEAIKGSLSLHLYPRSLFHLSPFFSGSLSRFFFLTASPCHFFLSHFLQVLSQCLSVSLLPFFIPSAVHRHTSKHVLDCTRVCHLK